MEVVILHVVMMAVRHSAVGVARVATCTAVIFVRMYFARSVPCLILSHFLHAIFFDDFCLLGIDGMSGDTCDFNNIETRAVIKFFFLQGKPPKEIHAILIETLGEHAPSYATVKHWVSEFKRGDFSTCDAPRPGRPKTVTTPEIKFIC